MSIGGLLGGIPSLKKLQGASNDDWVDRINHVWTVYLDIIFAVIVSTSQFVGNPIHCWDLRGDFKNKDYADSLCWIQNTYRVYDDERVGHVNDNVEDLRDREVTYYQWVPLILLLQAFLYKFPNIMWRVFNGGSGINMDKVVDMADATQLGSLEERDKAVDLIAKYMDRWLMASKRFYNKSPMNKAKRRFDQVIFCFNKRQGTYLTHFYIFIKVLYVINAVSQFFIMNAFLSHDFGLYGYMVMKRALTGEMDLGDWSRKTRFPQVTICEFNIKAVGGAAEGVHHTAQCVLPINLFNEKLFIILWFWMVLVAAVTCFNFMWWVYFLLIKKSQYRHVRTYLKVNGSIQSKEDKTHANQFTNEYLRNDGVFVIRTIAKNSTDLIAADLVGRMWSLYMDSRHKRSDTELGHMQDAVLLKHGSNPASCPPMYTFPENVNAFPNKNKGNSFSEGQCVKN